MPQGPDQWPARVECRGTERRDVSKPLGGAWRIQAGRAPLATMSARPAANAAGLLNRGISAGLLGTRRTVRALELPDALASQSGSV